MVLPLAHLGLRAAGGEDPLGQVLSGRVLRLVLDTLLLAATVTALAVVIGVGIAWLVERSDLPGRRLLGVAAALPLVVPTYVGALALLAALGPRGLAWEVPGVIGFWGATAALSLSTYPYVLLLARAVLRSADPALEEAARALGDTAWSSFRRVLLPGLRPAMAAGGLLVFLYVLSDFGAVSIMRFDTVTRAIYVEYRSSFDRARPALLGLVLVALTLAVVAAELRLRGRPAPAQVVAGLRPAPQALLGRWRWPAAAGVVVVVFAGIGLPVAVLGYWSIVGSSGADTASVIARAALTSAQVSAMAAVLAVAAALPVAVLAVRHRSRLSRAVEVLALSGYALPGLVIALAMVFFAARFLPALYQTLTILVLAYLVRFLPEALGSVRSSLLQVDPALEEAGRSLGRSRLSVACSVTFPLIRGGVLAGAALVFLTAMKELPATLLLLPAGDDTLAVRVWTSASQGLYAQAAPAALVLVAVTGVVLWPLWGLAGRRRLLVAAPEVPVA
jgi:iron(III) transport system permease protein